MALLDLFLADFSLNLLLFDRLSGLAWFVRVDRRLVVRRGLRLLLRLALVVLLTQHLTANVASVSPEQVRLRAGRCDSLLL